MQKENNFLHFLYIDIQNYLLPLIILLSTKGSGKSLVFGSDNSLATSMLLHLLYEISLFITT